MTASSGLDGKHFTLIQYAVHGHASFHDGYSTKLTLRLYIFANCHGQIGSRFLFFSKEMTATVSSDSAGPPQSFRIQTIDSSTAHFEEVIALHAKRKARLGPFPRGAFEEHADKKLLLGAIDENNKLAGYLLYRRSRSKASIVHLTRYDEYDGNGITKLLVEHTINVTMDLPGVSLRCRQDYGLNHMWSAFGFTIRATKPGRGSDGALVDYWWHDHGHDDLFSMAAEESARISAAIDANVLYDLAYSDRSHHEDTSVLLADWIQDGLELCVTRELYNEIARSETSQRQEIARSVASGYRELKVSSSELDAVVTKLQPVFGTPSNPRDISDMMQLAHSIAGGVPFLVTRDGPMLARKDKILELFPIEILHPTSLVNHFDTLQRGAAYRPALLEGSSWQRQLILASEIEEVIAAFKHGTERKNDFEREIRGYLAHPQIHQAFLIRDQIGSCAVLYVITKESDTSLRFPLLRHSSHAAAPTIVRHIVHDTSITVPAHGYLHVIVSDKYLSNESCDSLKKIGFVLAKNHWHKISVSGIHSFEEAQTTVANSQLPKELIDAVCNLKSCESNRRLVEQRLCPVKISSPEAHAFVVSIRKGWAEQLFTMSFDGQALLNTENRLLIGIEGVYYCSAVNKHVTAPSRVLWYISQGPDGKGPMTVVACSQMEEIMVGKPKIVFAKYRNLGVYSWPNVFETAGRSLDAELLAFRFVRTEKFIKPVSNDTLASLGIAQPQNPRKISDEQFASIYRIGMNLP